MPSGYVANVRDILEELHMKSFVKALVRELLVDVNPIMVQLKPEPHIRGAS